MNEVEVKQQEYRDYILNHLNNVKKAWEVIKERCRDIIIEEVGDSMYNNYISLVDSQVKVHDKSKFSKEEFEPYRMHWHPINEEEKEKSKEAYALAWKHHYYNNMHHWDWWAETNQKENMSYNYILEMIADWQAMSYTKGGNPLLWYRHNKSNIDLGIKQERQVMDLLMSLCVEK